MKYLILSLPIALAACGTPVICPPLRTICDTADNCTCQRGEGTSPSARPGEPARPDTRPEPEPEEPGGHWATRDNEPDSRVDPEGHRDWQRDRDRQIEEGTW